ncbi:MAG: hypothetical protein AAGF24_05010 [Cyanobacteria bacterium P01_H01_bin.121]
MDLNRFCVKFLVRPGSEVDEANLIPIFQDWIRLRRLNGTLLDVADYRHVPDGPGVMLVTHEINYAMEHVDGQFGLSAQRKLGEGTTHRDRIVDLVQAAAAFGSLLEADGRLNGQLTFDGSEFLYIANDRLNAPNTTAAFEALQPDLAAAAALLYGEDQAKVTQVETDPRDRLTVAVKVAEPTPLSRLATA